MVELSLLCGGFWWTAATHSSGLVRKDERMEYRICLQMAMEAWALPEATVRFWDFLREPLGEFYPKDFCSLSRQHLT